MADFNELAASRRAWIQEVLVPWCRSARLKDLRRAEHEWGDIAGRVDPDATLWTWAWSRFPELTTEELSGLDETYPISVTLRDGSTHTGYPDARHSVRGTLVLLGEDGQPTSPLPIDEIQSVSRA